MIYQFSAYFGAVLNGVAVYSVGYTMDDCRALPTEPFKEVELVTYLRKQIMKDGFDPDVFEYRWLTKSEYENKVPSKVKNYPITL